MQNLKGPVKRSKRDFLGCASGSLALEVNFEMVDCFLIVVLSMIVFGGNNYKIQKKYKEYKYNPF